MKTKLFKKRKVLNLQKIKTIRTLYYKFQSETLI